MLKWFALLILCSALVFAVPSPKVFYTMTPAYTDTDTAVNFVTWFNYTGKVVANSPYVVYNTTDQSFDFSSTTDYITVNSASDINVTGKNFSVSAWVYPRTCSNPGNDNYGLVSYHWTYGQNLGFGFQIICNSGAADGELLTYMGNRSSVSTNKVSFNAINMVTMSYNGSHVCYYINSTFSDCDALTYYQDNSNGQFILGAENGGYRAFNGTLKYFRFWDNYSLNSSDVSSLYSSGYPSGSFGSTNVTVDFASSVGVLRSDFFGFNTHDWIGKQNTSVFPLSGTTSHDYAYGRTMLTYMGDWLDRYDLNIDSGYWTLPNVGAELWGTNYTLCTKAQGSAITGNYTGGTPVGWACGVGSNANSGGNITRTTDSHSGSYAVNITSNGSASDIFSYYDVPTLDTGHNYSFSVWLKSPNSANYLVYIQKKSDFTTVCSASGTATSTWTRVWCNVTDLSVSVSQGFRLPIIAHSNGTLQWDDAQFLQDDVTYRNFTITSERLDRALWINSTGKKLFIIAGYNAVELANVSTFCDPVYTSWSNCNPTNATEWARTVAQEVYQITRQCSIPAQVEVWNEPYGNFFMPSLAQDSVTKVSYLVALHIALNTEIKALCPNIDVINPSFYWPNAPYSTESYIQQIGNNTDGANIHLYDSTLAAALTRDFNRTLTVAQSYGVTYTTISMSEYNDNSAGTKNSSNSTPFFINVNSGILSMVKKYPTIAQMVLYQASEQYNYNDTTHYPEYPSLWAAFSESALDKKNYTTAYIYHNASTHFNASTIYSDDSVEPLVESVPYHNSSGYYLAVFNGRGRSWNYTYNFTGATVYGITFENGTNVSATNSQVTFSLGPYDMQYMSLQGCNGNDKRSQVCYANVCFFSGTYCQNTKSPRPATKHCSGRTGVCQ